MLRNSMNSVSQLCRDNKTRNEARIDTSGQSFNTDELAIPAAEAANEPDPLKIEESEKPDQFLLIKPSFTVNVPVKTYSKRQPKILDRPKTLVPKEFLKSMVYEALESVIRPAGIRLRDIMSFILSKYDVNVDRNRTCDVLQDGVASGEITQIKRKGTPLLRFQLATFWLPKAKQVSKKTENPASSPGSTSLNDDSRKTGVITDVEIEEGSRGNDNDIQSSGHLPKLEQIPKKTENSASLSGSTSLNDDSKKAGAGTDVEIEQGSRDNDNDIQSSEQNDDPNFSKIEEISEGESSSALGTEKQAEASKLGTKATEEVGDPIYANEIDFMVLHSLHSSPNNEGMSITDIAEFIRSFYGVDVPRSLPRIERYLDYSVEKGVLIRNGDRYKKSADTWKVDSRGKKATPQLLICGSNRADKKFILTEVKLEPEEAENFLNSRLAMDRDKVEMNVNNNVVRSVGKKSEPKIVKTFKIKRKNFISSEDISHFSTIQKWAAQKTYARRKIEQDRRKLERSEDARVSLVRYYEKKKQIEAENTKPSIPSESGEKIPVPSENFEPFSAEKKYSRTFSELKDAFQTPMYHKFNISIFNFKELESLKNQKPRGRDCFGIKMAPDRYRRLPAIRFGLSFVIDYLSQHPLTVFENPGDLSWKEIALTENSFCLKLTGESTPSLEALNCDVCGLQLTFGPSNCPACSFELKNFVEKCEICHLLCNREDVFLKHFLWEHSPSFQGEEDNDYLSVAQDNIVKILNKLADGDYLHCRLCMYMSIKMETFEAHVVGTHTTKTNVFPPLPEVDDLDKVGIFRNEISNTCCYKCSECGFISNRRDYVVYHMLEVHIVVDKENYEELLWNLETEDMKRSQTAKTNHNFGLCPLCGKFYSNIRAHMDVHNGRKRKALQSIEEPETSSTADATLQKPKRAPRKKRPRPTLTNDFLCHICGKRMNRRLQEHLRCHANEMYPCAICGKEFNRQSNLFTHKRVHTREKPFECDICKMRFGYKCSIKGHIINVHLEGTR